MKQSLLARRVEEVISRENIEKRIEAGEKLRIKYGIDPTSPDIHLGHGVVFWKLREFQQRGHHIILIIGDYTAKIGDPSGKNKTRPMLEDKDIEYNAKTYLKQIGKILDMKKVEVQRNSKWYGHLSFADLLRLTAKFTVAQILERDDFQKRYSNGIDVGLHEMLYPLMQAYDSVMVKADVEIGGTDQKFNMMAGRDLQKKMGQLPQDVITVQLLVGVDGKEKMSKSLGNSIGITDQPFDMYGKVMSIPDEQIIPYFQLATDLSDGGLNMVKKELEEGVNPRDVKARLAFLITELYYDSTKAEEATKKFDETFRDKKVPLDIPKIALGKSEKMSIVELMLKYKIVTSKSEARRLIEQGGVKVDKNTVEKIEKEVVLDDDVVLQVGKRKFYKFVIKKSARK